MGFYSMTVLASLALCSAVLGMCVVDVPSQVQNVRLAFTPYAESFSAFKQEHGRQYTNSVEEAYRYSVFKRNIKAMEDHNRKYAIGESTYFMNVNHFSDMTHDEYLRYNHLGKYSKGYKKELKCFQYKLKKNAPHSIDWTTKGAVTPVKNQGLCGSCYTFSSTGSIEGQNFINTGKLLSFSEQQIVDCCKNENCEGCDGGLMDTVFLYINKTGGLELENEYQYTAHAGKCLFNEHKVKVDVVGCSDIPATEDALKDAVANVGPIAVAIDASLDSFQSYAGGVYDEPNCSTSELDHAVLAVGYGTLNGTEFWLVKNSWGNTWGEQGYIRMSRNKQDQCGIASSASFPHTAKTSNDL